MLFLNRKILCLFCMLFMLQVIIHGKTNSKIGCLDFNKSGVFRIGRVRGGVIHFGPSWKSYNQLWRGVNALAGYPSFKDDMFVLKSRFVDNKFDLNIVAKSVDTATCSYHVILKAKQRTNAQAILLNLMLPLAEFDQRQVDFDNHSVKIDKNKKLKSALFKNLSKITLPTLEGKLEISGQKLNAYIQDDRRFGGKSYSLRIFFKPGKGAFVKSELKLLFKLKPYQTESIDITSACNMGFKDETANDKKGGWTDQGNNDLRCMTSGEKELGGVKFKIINPAENKQKACMIFNGPSRTYFLKNAQVQFAKRTAPYLYLLHGMAWSPTKAITIGTVKVNYADGDKQYINIIAGKDLADWWSAYGVTNGLLAWRGKNTQSSVGLFMSKFKLRNKPFRSLEFTANGKGVWMIVAISCGDNVPQPIERKSVIIADKRWLPLKHSLQVKHGSVLDFSFLLDAPAGKHGTIVIRNGHFEFVERPGERVRFYGANICNSANFQSKKACESLAEQFAQMGYNAVRFHHFDRYVVKRGASTSTELALEKIDQLDYLFYCMKRRGIYVSIDLFTSRYMKLDEIPELNRWAYPDFKALVPVLDSAMNNWKAFAKTLLTHINPYTKMAWKDDPALIGICVLNEDNTYLRWDRRDDIKKIYYKRFAKWLKVNKHSRKSKGGKYLMSLFLLETNMHMYQECKRFLRKLGVKAPLTDANVDNSLPFGLFREQLDYVDNHLYWDIGRFVSKRGKLPYGYCNESAIKHFAELPRKLMPSRIFGKPFTVTEFNYSYPNHYRAEGGVLMGAYAGLQNWDGLFRFAYAHNREKTQIPASNKSLDIVGDPISLLSDRIGILLFLRGDIKKAAKAVPYLISDKILEQTSLQGDLADAPDAYTLLGLVSRIGTVNLSANGAIPQNAVAAVGQQQFPQNEINKLPYWQTDASLLKKMIKKGIFPATKLEIFNSDTRQLRLDSKAISFQVVSDKTECFVIPRGKLMKGKKVKVKNAGDATVVCVSALDGKKLQESKHLIVFHLTDIQNTDTTYRDRQHRVLTDWGKLPLLVRKDTAYIALKSDCAASIYRIDLTGKRCGQVKSNYSKGWLSFTAPIKFNNGNYLVYEIIKNH